MTTGTDDGTTGTGGTQGKLGTGGKFPILRISNYYEQDGPLQTVKETFRLSLSFLSFEAITRLEVEQMREKPTFARWRRTHAAIARKKPIEFRAKFDSRKPYHWTVLTYLEYDPATIGAVQPTWFMGRGGQPTAWGQILSRWEKGPRECFLVEAWNRRSSDTYIVVFGKTGTFITAYSTTRTDVPAPVYPIAPKRARALLKLNAVVPEMQPREITDDAVLQTVTNNPVRAIRARERVWRIYIPFAEMLGLVRRQGDSWYFMKDVPETSRLILLLCPAASQSV